MRKKGIFIFISILLLMLLPGIGAAANDGVNYGDEVGYHRETGMVSFIGTDPDRAISVQGTQAAGMQAADQRAVILGVYAPLFGERNPAANLTETSFMQRQGRTTTRYQQTYQGIPILAGEVILNTNPNGELLSISGELSPDLDLSVEPGIAPEQAAHTAATAIAKYYGGEAARYTVSEPALWIYDSRLLEPTGRPPSLVWRMEVRGAGDVPVRALVLVDAQYGFISLQFNQIDTTWAAPAGPAGAPADAAPVLSQPEAPSQTAGTPTRLTYTANNGTALPGTLVCSSDDAACAIATADADVLAAHAYAGDTYDFYWTHHGRDSIDDYGMTLISSVHYDVGYYNAFWDGYQMVYGDGETYAQADDVVGHELTHGVTDYTSMLLYYYQSGAINESFSDLWGEFVDQTNGSGSDDLGDRWYMGEDIGVGDPADVAIRNMAHPPEFFDPDMMSSGYYYTGSGDNGGVHYNSGVNNKAVYLMVDGDGGGGFNGYSITGIGIDKVAAIYYEVQTSLLTSGSDYLDLYYAINQACFNLTGGGEGITEDDCTQVSYALWAVEMNEEPYLGFNPEAEVCPGGTAQQIIFEDDFESGVDNWSSNTIVDWWPPLDPEATGTVWPWVWGVGYATSGYYDYWGIDASPENPNGSGGILRTKMVNAVSLPATASPLYLRFNHSFDFEIGAYDGGILEYQENGGAWTDAYSLFVDGQDYNGTLNAWIPTCDGCITTPSNPKGGSAAFTNASHGYVSSRYDLSAFAGQDINIRFLVAVDSNTGDYGWDIDDVQIYSCVSAPDTPTGVTASDGTFPTKVKVTWDAVADAAYYKVLRDTDSFGGSMSLEGTTTGTSFDDTTTTDLLHYFYFISTCNAAGCSIPGGPDEGWSDLTAVSYLFESDFEENNLLEWSNYNDGGGFLYACAQGAMNGSYGACVERGTNDNRKQLIDTTPNNETVFNARFNFDVNSLSMGLGDPVRIMQFKMGAERPAFLTLQRFADGYKIQLNVKEDDLSKSKTVWVLLTDAPHTIEVDWAAATSPGANDGYITLYVDDVEQDSLTGLDNDTFYITSFRMGFTSRLAGKAISGIYYVDDVATGNTDYIGPP